MEAPLMGRPRFGAGVFMTRRRANYQWSSDVYGQLYGQGRRVTGEIAISESANGRARILIAGPGTDLHGDHRGDRNLGTRRTSTGIASRIVDSRRGFTCHSKRFRADIHIGGHV